MNVTVVGTEVSVDVTFQKEVKMEPQGRLVIFFNLSWRFPNNDHTCNNLYTVYFNFLLHPQL